MQWNDNTPMKIYTEKYFVLRQTKCFYIIKISGRERKVGINTTKRFANITEEGAIKDLYYRNRRTLRILNARLDYHYKGDKLLRELTGLNHSNIRYT